MTIKHPFQKGFSDVRGHSDLLNAVAVYERELGWLGENGLGCLR